MAEHPSEQIEKVITDSLVSFGADADDRSTARRN